MGDTITFEANGSSLSGYLAKPEGNSKNKAVIVLQEWWGLVPHVKDICDRFAAEGYAALAPDLYRGETTDSPDDAGRMLMALDIDRAETDLRAAIAAVKEHSGVSGKVGVVGFCMGGQLALFAATTSASEVGAAVDYYGIHPNVKPDFANLQCPVLAFFGDRDDFVNQEAAQGLISAIEGAGKTVEHHTYEGTGHAFFNDSRPEAYDAEAAADSWKRTLAFFDSHL